MRLALVHPARRRQGFGSSASRAASARYVGQHHRDLIPADAAHDVRLARLPDQQLADAADHGVARRMSVGVVDRLEVVEVEIDEARLDLRGASPSRAHALVPRTKARRL